ncbi:MAG: TIGR01777 family oxidoreductase [Deltaproteobacteria bacterium]|nr:TIGR01777 family oxidoreductase [Deltaproteobacteria bacterium]
MSPLRVLVTGASGLLGSEAVARLSSAGHRVLRAVRAAPRGADEVRWHTGVLALGEPVDVVVHLAGEPLTAGRLTGAHLRRVRQSRVDATGALVRALAAQASPPAAFVCASAVGLYGHRPGEVLDEESAAGTGILAELCQAWERAAATAEQHGMRRVSLRFGVVMSPHGGALARLLPLFRAGLGGPLAGGAMVQPWISLDDAAAIVLRAVEDQHLRGALNAVMPEHVDNATFTRLLARAVHRPALLPVPAIALRARFGRVADEMLLASCDARPRRLHALGFSFRHPTVEAALRDLIPSATPQE